VLDQQLDDPADVHLFVFVQIEEPPGKSSVPSPCQAMAEYARVAVPAGACPSAQTGLLPGTRPEMVTTTLGFDERFSMLVDAEHGNGYDGTIRRLDILPAVIYLIGFAYEEKHASGG